MKLIGTGSFTKAYLRNDGKVRVKSSCPVKEVLAMGWCGNARFLPKIERVDFEEYVMPLYEKPKSLKQALKPTQYKFYQELRKIDRDNPRGYYGILEAIKAANLTRTQKQNMIAFLDGVANIGQGDVRFEISPRNVAVKNGNLILLDVFFSFSKLQSTRKR